MFEGDIRKSDLLVGGESEALRRLRWQDLVARLAATRDLRSELTQSSLCELASRGRFSSLSHLGPDVHQSNVNHDDLSDRKRAGISSENSRGTAAHKDQGTA